MKPYAGVHARGIMQRVLDYGLSRARRIVENAFGIFSAVFRVLRKLMHLEPDEASLVVLSTIHLHNFLRKSSSSIYSSLRTFDFEDNGATVTGQWREEREGATSFPNLRKILRK
ncbi:hypothetical protein JTB14_033916 [Gonioctena quinquepunctata]|nr:hypothetical protein JTB14_033916 [Gonioctena quinquepunctata]